MRILGIDPGSRITGYGLINTRGSQLEFVACGTIRTAGEKDFSRRLLVIFSDLSEIIRSYEPEAAAVEEVFLARLQVFNYSPRRVKQTVAGYGHADKAQIQYMVRMLLGLNAAPSSDAADALALAICHAHHNVI